MENLSFMKEIVVDKNFIKNYERLTLGLENVEAYSINTSDILDIYCVIKPSKDGKYSTDDGFIKISSNAKNNLPLGSNEEEEDVFTLNQRLINWKDVVSFGLEGGGRNNIEIYLPYDPLMSLISYDLIEETNCCSFETLEEGDMLLCFGKSSKTPKRKDNDYKEIVKGWSEIYGDFNPEILSVKLQDIHMFIDDYGNFLLPFRIKNRSRTARYGELEFLGVKMLQVSINFPVDGNVKIFLTKMLDGKIYVSLDGLDVEFFCEEIRACG